MRKVLILIGVEAIFIMVAAIAFVATINPNDYPGTIQGKNSSSI